MLERSFFSFRLAVSPGPVALAEVSRGRGRGGGGGPGWQGAAGGGRASGRRTRERCFQALFFFLLLLQLRIMIPLTCRVFFHPRISCQCLLRSLLVIRPCRLISTVFCESTGYYPLWIRSMPYFGSFRDVILTFIFLLPWCSLQRRFNPL